MRITHISYGFDYIYRIGFDHNGNKYSIADVWLKEPSNNKEGWKSNKKAKILYKLDNSGHYLKIKKSPIQQYDCLNVYDKYGRVYGGTGLPIKGLNYSSIDIEAFEDMLEYYELLDEVYYNED